MGELANFSKEDFAGLTFEGNHNKRREKVDFFSVHTTLASRLMNEKITQSNDL
jgi:hypothetical protein